MTAKEDTAQRVDEAHEGVECQVCGRQLGEEAGAVCAECARQMRRTELEEFLCKATKKKRRARRRVDVEEVLGLLPSSGRHRLPYPPLAGQEVKSFSVLRITEGVKERECALCWSELAAGEEARVLACDHFFHEDCLASWLKTSAVCPVCRRQLDAAWNTDEMDHCLDRLGLPVTLSSSGSSSSASTISFSSISTSDPDSGALSTGSDSCD